jgi:hypothetical protein
MQNEVRPNRPKVKLIGRNGNAFAILGACKDAMKRAHFEEKDRKVILDEMMAGDYNHLLRTAMKYFDVY